MTFIIHEYITWKLVNGVGFKIFSFFLFLGLELKFFFKIYLNAKILEPIGSFDINDPSQVKELFISILIFRLLLLVTAVTYSKINSKISRTELLKPIFSPWSFYVTAGFCIITLSLNMYFKVFQIGFPSMINLIWPLSFIFPFLISTGSYVAVIYCYEFINPKKIHLVVLLSLAALVSISILSRASYILLTLPLVAEALKKKSILNVILIFSIFFLSLSFIQDRRDVLYKKYIFGNYSLAIEPHAKAQKSKIVHKEVNTQIKAYHFNKTIELFITLMSDRWLGLEGAMTALSYKEQNLSVSPIFYRMIIEKPVVYGSPLYDLVSDSSYLYYQRKNQFHSLPGLLGFLLFSKSYFILCVGVFLLVLLGLQTQSLVTRLTDSCLVGIFFSCNYFYGLTQIGIYPINFLKQLVAWGALVVAIWIFGKLSNQSSSETMIKFKKCLRYSFEIFRRKNKQ